MVVVVFNSTMKKMKSIFISIAFLPFIIGCSLQKDGKDELNYISFDISKDIIIDSLKVATALLDKMDYGNGATCFIVDGKLHYTSKEIGFRIVKMPEENSASFPIIEPFDQAYSKQLYKLIQFLYRNGINSIGKSYDGIYSFLYKQKELNPHNNYKETRIIVSLTENVDTCSRFFVKDNIIIDRYKNLRLLAPEIYKEPKLPMDKESIMKRTKELMKKRQEKKN